MELTITDLNTGRIVSIISRADIPFSYNKYRIEFIVIHLTHVKTFILLGLKRLANRRYLRLR
jgi:hypothetical protein